MNSIWSIILFEWISRKETKLSVMSYSCNKKSEITNWITTLNCYCFILVSNKLYLELLEIIIFICIHSIIMLFIWIILYYRVNILVKQNVYFFCISIKLFIYFTLRIYVIVQNIKWNVFLSYLSTVS